MEDPNNPFAPRGPVVDSTNPYASPLAEERRGTAIDRPDQRLNPWFSMWTQPRATIRQIVETDPRHHVLLVTALGSAGQLPDGETFGFGADQSITLALVVGGMVASAAIGILLLFVLGWLTKVVAGWFGGRGNTLHTRAALGWSSVPSVWLLPIMIALNLWWVVDPPDLNLRTTPQMNAYAVVMAAAVIFFFWEIVIMSLAVAEVHQFSALRGLASFLLAALLAFAALIILMIPLILLVVALS